MKIYITTGTSVGPATLAAFDAALLDAGVAAASRRRHK